MIVALLGEGKNDYGIENYDGTWKEGALQPLLRHFNIFKTALSKLKFRRCYIVVNQIFI